MYKRTSYIILFLSLSGLLFANGQKTVSLSLPVKKCVRNTSVLPTSADDFITIDFRTNYYFVRSHNHEQDDYNHQSAQPCEFFKENVLKGVFVQRTLNFFKNRSIHLLNCTWLI